MIKQTEHSVLRSNELSMCIYFLKAKAQSLIVDDENVEVYFKFSLFTTNKIFNLLKLLDSKKLFEDILHIFCSINE